jgi:hypothetical protein
MVRLAEHRVVLWPGRWVAFQGGLQLVFRSRLAEGPGSLYPVSR